jgi:hypothetical protein
MPQRPEWISGIGADHHQPSRRDGQPRPPAWHPATGPPCVTRGIGRHDQRERRQIETPQPGPLARRLRQLRQLGREADLPRFGNHGDQPDLETGHRLGSGPHTSLEGGENQNSGKRGGSPPRLTTSSHSTALAA